MQLLEKSAKGRRVVACRAHQLEPILIGGKLLLSIPRRRQEVRPQQAHDLGRRKTLIAELRQLARIGGALTLQLRRRRLERRDRVEPER